METIISTETTTKVERKVALPFYVKVMLTTKEPIIFAMYKIFSDKECIRVTKGEIGIYHSGMAFNFPDWQEATKDEFEMFLLQTSKTLNDLVFESI